MSAALVVHLDMLQCLQDDLESTLYVILWMAIIYSPCNHTYAVPGFLHFDPQIEAQGCCYNKVDFLEAKSFLKRTKFVGQLVFDQLAYELADLFSA